MPCQEVVVAEPIPDESTVLIQDFNVDSPSPNTVDVSFEVVNEVISGSGERRNPTVEILVGGSQVETVSPSLSQGSSESYTVAVNDVESGSVNICAEFV